MHPSITILIIHLLRLFCIIVALKHGCFMSLIYTYTLWLAHLNYCVYGCDLHICQKYKDCNQQTRELISAQKMLHKPGRVFIFAEFYLKHSKFSIVLNIQNLLQVLINDNFFALLLNTCHPSFGVSWVCQPRVFSHASRVCHLDSGFHSVVLG